jgi:tetratricopeptide (TPR) repeat protein
MGMAFDLLAAGNDEADALVENGLKYYQQARYEEAAVEWEKALTLNPDHKLANFYIIKAAEEKNKVDYYTILGIRNFEKKDYKNSLDDFNGVFEFDVRNSVAAQYVNKIGVELDKDIPLKNKLIKDLKGDGHQYAAKHDLASVKRSLALYNTVSLLSPQDQEAKTRTNELQQRIPAAFKDENIKTYLQIGDEYLKEQKYDEAITMWRKCLILDPERRDLEDKIIGVFKLKVRKEKEEQISRLLKEGLADMNSGLTSTALALFEEVLRLEPGHSEALKYREQLLEKRKNDEEKKNMGLQIATFLAAGRKYFEKDDFQKARVFFQDVLALDDSNREARDYLAKCESGIKNQAEKMKAEEIDTLQRLLQEGMTNYKAGNFDAAVARLTECLRLSPDNKFISGYLDLAKKALWVKREEEIDIRSPFYNMVNNMISRGMDLFQNREYEKSLEVWKSVLFIFPLNRLAREYIVECSKYISSQVFEYFIREHIENGKKYLKQGQDRYALSEFQLVKKLFPRRPGIDELIASASPEQKKKSIDYQLVNQYYNEGLAFYDAKRYDEAIKSWEKVLSLDPGHEKAILNITKVTHMLNYDTILNQRVQAAAHDQEAEKIYLKGLQSYYNGDYQNAIRMWEQVLSLDPGNVKARNNIRTCSLMLKRNY